MCHRTIFRRKSHNKKFMENFCIDVNDPFHFACCKWYSFRNPHY